MKKFLILLVITSIFLSGLSFAFDLSFYNSFETLCMGETFTGISNDSNALFYNPAGLTNARGLVVKLPSMDVDMSYGAASATIKAITHIDEIKTVLNSRDNIKIANYFLKNYSKALSARNDIVARSCAYVGYEGNNLALMVSAIGQSYITSFVSNDIIPFISLHAKAAAYAGVSGALAVNWSKVKISVGGTYRYGYLMPHIYSINNLSALMINSSTFEPDLSYERDSNADLGVKASFGDIHVGVLWHDFTTLFLPDIRVGVGYTNKNIAIGVDFEKLLDDSYSIFRRIHVGMNYSPVSFFHLYAGISAGWFTGGLKINIGSLSIYGGTYVLNYGYNAGFDYQRLYTIGFGF